MALFRVGPNSVDMWEKIMRQEQLDWSQSKVFLYQNCDSLALARWQRDYSALLSTAFFQYFIFATNE